MWGKSDTFDVTPGKIIMEPEYQGLEDDYPFQTINFEVPC